VVAFALQIVFATAAHATTYNLSPTPALGECNIYDAVNAINNSTNEGGCLAGSSSNTINLAAGTYSLAVLGAIPNISFDGDLTVSGAGATSTIIDGAGNTGINFSPTGGVYTLTISNLTIQNFTSADSSTALVSYTGNLVGSNLLIHDNNCTDPSSPVCVLILNGSEGQDQSISLTSSAVYNNSSYALIGVTNISGSSLTANIINNTFYGNDGIVLIASNANSEGQVTINFINNTVSNNNFPEFLGGGWLLMNSAFEDADLGPTQVNTRNNIFNSNLSGATPSNCSVNTSSNGTETSKGGNIASDNTCATIYNDPHDLHNTDPLLATPSIIDGTYIMALQAGSPAIDNGLAGGDTPGADQRGVSRPQGAAPDSGSYELAVAPAPVPAAGTLASTGWDTRLPAIVATLFVLLSLSGVGYTVKKN